MNEVEKIAKEIEKQLLEVRYHVSCGRFESAAIKSEYVKRAANDLFEALKKFNP